MKIMLRKRKKEIKETKRKRNTKVINALKSPLTHSLNCEVESKI